jgi:hypothetical protein
MSNKGEARNRDSTVIEIRKLDSMPKNNNSNSRSIPNFKLNLKEGANTLKANQTSKFLFKNHFDRNQMFYKKSTEKEEKGKFYLN